MTSLGEQLGRAIGRGMQAIVWGRTPEQMPSEDEHGMIDDPILLEALANAIESIPGVVRI